MCSRTSVGRIPGLAVIMMASLLVAGCGDGASHPAQPRVPGRFGPIVMSH